MDGGAIFSAADTFATVWQRSGAIILARPGNAEVHLGSGTQPVALTRGADTHIFFQRGPDLLSTRLDASLAPTAAAPHAKNARFPALLALPADRGAILSYEQGPAKGPTSVVVERL